MSTGGPRWTRSERWLQGEPCTDGWEGVVCCRESEPLLTADALGCTDTPGGAPISQPLSGAQSMASLPFAQGGCRSDSYTGTVADRALCVVVALDLGAFGLRGNGLDLTQLCELRYLQELRLQNNNGLGGSTLGGGGGAGGGGGTAEGQHRCMSRLRVLDVSGDGLRGELPAWVIDEPALTQIQLRGNRFSAPSLWSAGGNTTEAAQTGGGVGTIGERMQVIVTRCRSDANLACDGLPPASCAAFGPDYKLRTEDPTRCTYCDPNLFAKTVALLIGAVVAACSVLGVYVMLISGRHAQAMNRWVSTLSLFFAHLQTIAVIGNLALDWPPRVKAITGAVSLSVVSASFLRPEVSLPAPRPLHVAGRALALSTCPLCTRICAADTKSARACHEYALRGPVAQGPSLDRAAVDIRAYSAFSRWSTRSSSSLWARC